MAEQKTDVRNQIALQQNMSEEQLITYPQRDRQRSRSLGLLETMYHTYNCREVDVCPIYFGLSCKQPVTRYHVSQALFHLMDLFPALRLTIVPTGRYSYKFVEKRHMPIPFQEIHATASSKVLNKECHYRFDFSRGPLWKFSLINSPVGIGNQTDHSFSFQFLFTFHHAISDFHQTRSIVNTFIKSIVQLQGVLPSIILPTEHRPLYPSIEHVIPLDLVKEFEHRCSIKWPRHALDLYNTAFASEVSLLQNSDKTTDVSLISLNETDTKLFFQQCKQQQVKVTSAIVAAMTISFANLVLKAIPTGCAILTVPVEIVVDLRHYILDNNIKDSFSSVAAIHMPFLVDIDLLQDISSKQFYWNLAKHCQSNLVKHLSEGEPMKVLLHDVPSEIKQPIEKGKSPFVLTFSNLGCLDDLVPAACKDVMKLEDFLPWTNVSVDDMPIFCTGIHTFNNSINMAIGSCGSYTSKQTTNKFTAGIIKLLQNHSSKL